MVVDEFSLFKAIAAGDSLNAIRAIVKERPQSVRERPKKPKGVQWNGWPSNASSTALHAAIEFGLPDASIRFIYRRWPQALQEKDSSGNTPWHSLANCYGRSFGDDSAQQLSVETLQLFARDFPETIRETNRNGTTPLYAAASNSNLPLDVLRFIFEQHPEAIVHRCGGGRLPLHASLTSMQGPSEENVRFLLRQYPHAVRIKREDDGYLPLHVAAQNDALTSLRLVAELADEYPDSIVQQTIDDSSDTGARMHNPVHLVAAREGPPEPTIRILRHLLQLRPAAIRQRTDCGSAPLHHAVTNRAHSHVVRFLVARRRQALMEWTSHGSLPLHIAATQGASLETFTFLANEYPEAVGVVERDGYGCVLLHSVAVGGYPSSDAIRICVRHHPDSVRALNGVRRAPIHVAVNYGSSCYGQLLLEAVQILAELAPETLRIHDTYGRIPLHILLTCKDPPVEVVRCLVTTWPRSVLVPTLEKKKRYPVCIAAENPHASLDVLYYLVKQSPAHFFLIGRP